MVYQNMLSEANIWELPTPSSPNRQPSGDATYRRDRVDVADTDMRFSPDGTRIAFASRRSGHFELWVSNRDGSQPNRLTNFEGQAGGKPVLDRRRQVDRVRRAPPGRGSWNLYIVPADGGPVKPLTSDAFNNTRPSWSLDGRWIYFASDRTKDWQIWRMPSAGGKPEPITGGAEGSLSSRGTADASTTLSRRLWRASGRSRPREARKFRSSSTGAGQLNFDVAENGIFMMDTSATPQVTVEMFSFASRQIVPVARLPPGVRIQGVSYLTVTRDGRSMLYARFDQSQSDIEMLPGFR